MRCRTSVARQGYTLVELLVVVGVLAIAGTLLLPNLVDRGTFAIQAAARSVVSDIVFAQSDGQRRPFCCRGSLRGRRLPRGR